MEKKQTKSKSMRSFIGQVVSAAMEKTAVVKVDALKMHPKYKKSYRVSEKFHIHDEKKIAKVGDTVKFVECRPLSKTKRWRLAAVIKEQK
ncbi:MAG TPA: 30S ribosomal protein S17 [Candidatus Magasanikbacteria bacterium]|nr:30S ribosomal protein S17 [Candidatus Magasanikbacteria bacterium]